jgi:hypothetical protein
MSVRKYTEAIADKILERIIDGEAIKTICKDPDIPSFPTILKWSTGRNGAADNFPERYAAAFELRGEAAADKIIEITRKLEAGEIGHNEARVIIDSQKWIASKLRPKLYGDRREHNHNVKVDVSVADRLRRADNRIADHAVEMIDVTPQVVEDDT